jgi:hypothetical protein
LAKRQRPDGRFVAGSQVGHCQACQAEIVFVREPSGKLNPISLATGRSHFEDCPKAEQFRKSKQGRAIAASVPRKPKPKQGAFDL